MLTTGGGGGEGVWDPKVCVPKRARPDFPNCKFRFFPRWSLWSGGGGGRVTFRRVGLLVLNDSTDALGLVVRPVGAGMEGAGSKTARAGGGGGRSGCHRDDVPSAELPQPLASGGWRLASEGGGGGGHPLTKRRHNTCGTAATRLTKLRTGRQCEVGRRPCLVPAQGHWAAVDLSGSVASAADSGGPTRRRAALQTLIGRAEPPPDDAFQRLVPSHRHFAQPRPCLRMGGDRGGGLA